MTNLTDSKPVACGGTIMRRTDSHVTSNNKIDVTVSGDQYLKPPLFNLAETKYPDSDPRWGKDWCETLASDNIVDKDNNPLITEVVEDNIIQE